MRLPWHPRHTITIYTRTNCGLCRQAEALAHREAPGHTIHLIDIDADPHLQRLYNIRVPVILLNDSEIAEGGLQKGHLKAALKNL